MKYLKYSMRIDIYKGENRLLVIPIEKNKEQGSFLSGWYVALPCPTDREAVGEAVRKAIERIKETSTMPYNEVKLPNAAWEVNTKAKSWVSFCNKNEKAIVVITEEGTAQICSLERSAEIKGIYKGIAKEIEIPVDSSWDEYGQAVLDVFSDLEKRVRNKASDKKIKLLNESELSFISPKERHFEDSEDMGAMECYQSYSYIAKEGDEPSAVFFFSMAPEIDCDLSFENVKRSWEACYEIAENFEMKEEQKGIFAHCAEMKNKSVYKKSYFLKQEEDLILECGMMVYKPNRRKKLCEKLDGMFEEFVLSCKQIEE